MACLEVGGKRDEEERADCESGARSAEATTPIDQSATGKRKAEGPEDEGRARDQQGGSSSSGGAPEAATSSSGPKGPKVKSKFDKKKHTASEVPAVDLSPSPKTEFTLPSFGKALLRPRDDGIDLAESKAKEIVSGSQKRSGESSVGPAGYKDDVHQ